MCDKLNMFSKFYDAIYNCKVLDRVWVQFRDEYDTKLIHEGEFIVYNWDAKYYPVEGRDVILTLVSIEKENSYPGVKIILLELNINRIIDFKNAGIFTSDMNKLTEKVRARIEMMITDYERSILEYI